jgi:hypothetical protein
MCIGFVAVIAKCSEDKNILSNQCLFFFLNSSSRRPKGTQHVVFLLGRGHIFQSYKSHFAYFVTKGKKVFAYPSFRTGQCDGIKI